MLRTHFKLAFRLMVRRKFFTVVSLFGIGFTLTVLMIATALLDHVFGAHPPESRAERTLLVPMARMTGPQSSRTGPAGYRLLDEALRGLPGAEQVAVASWPDTATSYHAGQRIRSFLRRTDGAFWRILDFEFVEGRPFDDEDDREARRVAVINETTRDRFFGRGPAVGRAFEVDGQRYRVLGVVRDVPMTRIVSSGDIWVPIGTIKSDAFRRELVGDFMGIVLRRPGATPGRLEAELQDRLARLSLSAGYERITAPLDTLFGAFSRFLFSSDLADDRSWLLGGILGIATLLFMALPAINLVNVNLSRIAERHGEIGLRRAFGATRGAIVLQLVLESIVMAMLGGLLALGAASFALDAIERAGVIPYADLSLNLRIFGWGFALAVAFGVLSGALPAWRTARLDPVVALRGRSG
jgi:putative ABC transport system permease protein